MSTSNQGPSKSRKAEWWVLLNCWEWPKDLPDRPKSGYNHNEREQIMGAMAVLSAIGGVDMALVDALWRDEPTRRRLIEENNAG